MSTPIQPFDTLRGSRLNRPYSDTTTPCDSALSVLGVSLAQISRVDNYQDHADLQGGTPPLGEDALGLSESHEVDASVSQYGEEEFDDVDLYYFSPDADCSEFPVDASAMHLNTGVSTGLELDFDLLDVPRMPDSAASTNTQATIGLGLLDAPYLIPILDCYSSYDLPPSGPSRDVDLGKETVAPFFTTVENYTNDSSVTSTEDQASDTLGHESFMVDDDEQMPGGWPAPLEGSISPFPSVRSYLRPQSIILDGFRITVTTAEDSGDAGALGLAESDSITSFYTAMESVYDNMHLLSASATRDFLHVPPPLASPSVLDILEEFACHAPTLPSAPFPENSEVNLWPLSRSPSTNGLLTPPDALPDQLVPSPEFASNFSRAQFPELFYRSSLMPQSARPSYYPWFDSFVEKYTAEDEDPLCTVTSEPQHAPQEPFEELWQYARSRASTERDVHPSPTLCSHSEASVDDGSTRAAINAFASVCEEIDDLLALYAPSESMGVLAPPTIHPGGDFVSGPVPVSVSDEDEEYYRAPATINLSAVGPGPEGVAQAARETFWQQWTRPSDEDLALIFKRRSDVPSGLCIFIEEDKRIYPLPCSEELASTFELLSRPGMRERLKQQARDSFLAHWKASLEEPSF
ncbi:hypothetical protein C8Q77DRAFT_929843 [Trametes polyzona]|nr:hypothetical protein C8Q77DRAFT_929843 [Trametes polyzona]